MPEWTINFLFVVLGAVLGLFGSIIVVRKQEKMRALAEFRNAFIDEILLLKSPEFDSRSPFLKTLDSAESKHLKAIEIIMPYLEKKEKDKINNAYKNYRNPRNLDDTPDTIYTLSFGLYYCEKDVVKDAINREINGIELAIENLYKIMNAVK
ncbi:MAG TPA: hypothetical protein PKG96_08100 [Bacilli bacterium]|jgi:hypothetical protein|nr:hypothetical protein [Bacilli bacterium]